MNCVEQFDPIFHWLLEGFSAGDQSRAAGPLIDDGGFGRIGQVVFTRLPARVDQAGAAHEAVGHLIAGEVDRVVGSQLAVDEVAGFAEVERLIAAVIGGHLLLDDISFDGDAEVIGLSGEVGAGVVVDLFFEGRIAQVAPKDRRHAQLMGPCEGFGGFLNLVVRLFRSEIDGGSDGDSSHFQALLDLSEIDLVESVGVAQQLIVVEFDDERDFVGVAAGDGAEGSQC